MFHTFGLIYSNNLLTVFHQFIDDVLALSSKGGMCQCSTRLVSMFQ